MAFNETCNLNDVQKFAVSTIFTKTMFFERIQSLMHKRIEVMTTYIFKLL